MRTAITSTLIMATLVVCFSVARAEPEQTDLLTTETQFLPDQLIRRPLVLTHGMVELSVHTEASLNSRANFQPVSIAPDLRYGLTEHFTVGLIHSNASMGFLGAVGNGLCLAGPDNQCPHLYNRTGLEGIYGLSGGRARWRTAVRGYAMLQGHGDTVPFGVTSGVGLRARWAKRKLALQFDPGAAVAFTRGGDAEFLVQVQGLVQYQLARRFAMYAGLGYYGPVDAFGALPLSAGVLFAVDKHIDLALAGALTDVSDSLDGRSLTVTVTYRM